MTAAPDLHWARPAQARGTGVLVLSGSSGRLDTARAELLASRGATALALRWFGGQGQPPHPREVPLETFTAALDLLARDCNRLAIVGLSYGAEAALLTAIRDSRASAVVALSPTDVVWEGHIDDPTGPPHSKWTWRGEPLPFVPFDRSWTPENQPPSFLPYYRRSRELVDPDVVAAASIPVEDFAGDLVLVAGRDDHVWPSASAAQAIVRRRAAAGKSSIVVEDPRAGHQILFPGEEATDMERPYLVGGDEGAAERLGAKAWPVVCEVLGLAGSEGSRPAGFDSKQRRG